VIARNLDRRQNRSAVTSSTTSRLPLKLLRPRPIATPTSAAAKAGASLTPSPIIMTAVLAFGQDDQIFWSGPSSIHGIDRQARATISATSPVAAGQHDALDAPRTR
jgi:hypothetical protein